MLAHQAHNKLNIPLCVDLDGTLIHTDIFVESFFALLKQKFLLSFLLPLWLLRGKAYLKQRIAAHVELDVRLLPYNEVFLDYLRQQRAGGRPLILATAADIKFARQIAQHLALFDLVIASDGVENLSGKRKLARFRETLGKGGFDYAGDARVDLKIWSHARRAILVNPGRRVRQAAEQVAQIERVFDQSSRHASAYLEELRLHQWFKNLLVFVPLIAAHQVSNIEASIYAILSFIAFGLCASSGYLLNDLLDLSSDRQHLHKRSRPFAAGTIPIVHGAILAPLLLVAGLGIALAVTIEFLLWLAVYYMLTASYSLWLKQLAVLDVLVLAVLYTLRVIAGAAAIGVEPSFWLLAFSMFVFLSLAMVKRYAELLGLKRAGQEKATGRGYEVADLSMLQGLGAASGYLSVLVLALYVNSPDIERLYSRPQAIWLLCPLLLYWIGRLWLKAHRGQVDDDPVVFAIKDRVSRLVAVAGALAMWIAI